MYKKPLPLPDKLKLIFDMLAQAHEDEDLEGLENSNIKIKYILDYGTDEEKYECALRLLNLRYGLPVETAHHDLTVLCASAAPKVKYAYLQNRVFSIAEDEHVLLYMQKTSGGFLDFNSMGELVTQLDCLRHRAYREKRPYMGSPMIQ